MQFWQSTKMYFSDPVVRSSFFRIFGITIALLVATLGFNWRVMRDGPFDWYVLFIQVGGMLPVCALLAFFYWRRVVKATIKEAGGWQELLELEHHEKTNLLKRMESEKIK